MLSSVIVISQTGIFFCNNQHAGEINEAVDACMSFPFSLSPPSIWQTLRASLLMHAK